MNIPHVSVLLEEMLSFFEGRKLRIFFDGTLGAGGHAEAILTHHPEIELFIGCDQDPTALSIAAERLKKWESKIKLFHGNFLHLDEMLESIHVKNVDGFFLT